LDDLNRFLMLTPEHADALAYRGTAQAGLGNWAASSRDFAAALKAGQSSEATWWQYGLACLGAGDQAGHRRACAVLLNHVRQTHSRSTAQRLAWLCALSPETTATHREAFVLASQLGVFVPDDTATAQTLAAVLLRQGKHELAIERLTAARNPGRPPL